MTIFKQSADYGYIHGYVWDKFNITLRGGRGDLFVPGALDFFPRPCAYNDVLLCMHSELPRTGYPFDSRVHQPSYVADHLSAQAEPDDVQLFLSDVLPDFEQSVEK